MISLMPLILPNFPTNVVEGLIGHLTNENEFWLPYPIPSVAASEPSFHPKSLVQKKSKAWRGSSWISINWFLYHGLIERGYNDLAQEISKRSTDLVLASGFREYYDPYTGEGLGATNFLWPGLVIDMFLTRHILCYVNRPRAVFNIFEKNFDHPFLICKTQARSPTRQQCLVCLASRDLAKRDKTFLFHRAILPPDQDEVYKMILIYLIVPYSLTLFFLK